MPLAFTYPLMKRYTYWPQLFLGITFNYGLILGWTSIENSVNLIPIILYFGAIFWTLGYDTIYGYQDITDDEIIGVKSTSIKFKESPKNFLNMSYLIFFLSLISVGLISKMNILFFFLSTILFYHLFFLQVKKFKKNDTTNCFKIFKSAVLIRLTKRVTSSVKLETNLPVCILSINFVSVDIRDLIISF